MEYYYQRQFNWDRRNKAFDVRLRTAKDSREADYSGEEGQVSNGDEQLFPTSLLGSFTKVLPHANDTGLLLDVSSFETFVSAIDTGDAETTASIPLGPGPDDEFSSAMASGAGVRGWESMAAGLAFSLQGPDSQRPTMPPAPQLDAAETGYELSEVYSMALCRDIPFGDFACNDVVSQCTDPSDQRT